MLSRFVFSIAMILINGLNGPVIPLQNDMSELVADLSSPDAQQRARAACLLGKKGRNAESAVPALIRILDDATPVERPACGDERWKSNEETSPGREAAVALSDMGRQTLDPLIDALADDSWVTRMHAALALGLIEDRRAVEPLTVRLTDEVPRVRARVAWALGMIEDHEGVGALTAVLTDESPNVREQSAWALGMIEDPGAVDALIEALKDESSDVREQAAWALGMIEDARALDALADAIKDDHADVREKAIWAIGRIH